MGGMSETPLPRPRQVTFAAALIMGGSALIVATVFERVAGLGSLETQEAIDIFLSEPPGDGLGLTAQSAESLLRVLSMVAGACATAAAILGFHVLKRHRGARVGLAVLALPLFVSGMAAGGFLASLVVASSVMLWFQPAKDWFDGVVRRPVEAERPGAARQSPPPPPSGPRAVQGFGSAPSTGPTTGPSAGPAGSTATLPAPAPGRTPPAARRPGALMGACVITWTSCGLAMLFMALSALTLLTVPDLVFEEVERQDPSLAGEGISRTAITTGTYATAGVVLLWGAAAIVFAVLAYRGVRAGRAGLLASAGVAGLVCLVGALFSAALVVPLVACAVTVGLLLRREVRAWFADAPPR